MKILILSDSFPPYNYGGAGRIAQMLALAYLKRGNEVVVITTVRHKGKAGIEREEGVKIYRIYARYPERWRAYLSLYNPQTIPFIREIFEAESPKIIHAHNVHFYLSYHSFKVAHSLKIPVVLTLHDTMTFDYGKFTQFVNPDDLSDKPNFNYKYRALAAVKRYKFWYFPFRNSLIRFYLNHYILRRIAVSHELRKALVVNGIRCTDVIHNGIDLERVRTTKAEVQLFKAKYGLERKRAVLFGGRVSYWKGAELLLHAMKFVIAGMPEAVLIILGRCGERIIKLARQLDTTDSLICPGWLTGSELYAAYGASDVVVIPSIYLDPFPTTALEAMALSKPVIGTCFGGVKEVVINGKTGYIVNPFNVRSLADKIEELLLKKDEAVRMGQEGHERINNEFTIQRCAGQYLKVFYELLGG